MSEYILGMDGGSSKTHCALFDIHGNRKAFVEWGPTNHECLKDGFQELKGELEKLFAEVAGNAGIQLAEIKKAVLGMSGVDTKKQHEIISGILLDLGIRDFLLCNDAFLGVKAGSKSGSGICAINGSGCTVAGIDPAGGMLQIGGQGELTGDRGGGSYLGKRVISSVYNALWKGRTATAMTDMMFELLGIKSKYDYMDTLTEASCGGVLNLGDIGRLLFKAANLADPIALEILNEVGREYARSIYSTVSTLNFDTASPIDVVLAGSVFVKGENPTVIDTIKDELRQKAGNRAFNFITLKQPPVAGAVIWAMQEAGIGTEGIFGHITGQLS